MEDLLLHVRRPGLEIAIEGIRLISVERRGEDISIHLAFGNGYECLPGEIQVEVLRGVGILDGVLVPYLERPKDRGCCDPNVLDREFSARTSAPSITENVFSRVQCFLVFEESVWAETVRIWVDSLVTRDAPTHAIVSTEPSKRRRKTYQAFPRMKVPFGMK